jgi:hypothetical protein
LKTHGLDQNVQSTLDLNDSLQEANLCYTLQEDTDVFVTGIVRLPKLYVNFNNEQYLSVFAIALPYTNPFKSVHHGFSCIYFHLVLESRLQGIYF